ncbi:MAG: DUF4337 family protein [Verrucomicrobia bacterium]|nr:DUF4337 family protein [Verrucomicrobiota bacterium]
MKAQVPDALKQDVPQTTWGKILTATPVIMTVVATALAGLSSSEMTRAQYDRSMAAQQQSKAGDQWSFFQAKRLRGSMQRSTLDVLTATTQLVPFALNDSEKQALAPTPAVIAAVEKGDVPPLPPEPAFTPEVKTGLTMIESSKPDAELAAVLAKVTEETLVDSVRAARDRADVFDAATKPITQAIDRLEKARWELAATTGRPVGPMMNGLTVARLRFTAARYDGEAKLNQSVAQLIELQVRKSNLTADRHHSRSQKFFYGMLAAQAAVIVSTFSLAARKHSALWSLAAAAGLAAVAFAVYVYFFV